MTKKTILIIIAIIIFVGGVVAASLTTSSLTKNKLKENLINQYAEDEMQIAVQIARHMEMEISAIYDKLVLISQMPEVVSGDPETCEKKLKEVFVNMREKVGNLGRMNSQGIFDCSVQELPKHTSGPAIAPHLKQIIEDEEHRAVLGRGLISPTNNRYVTSLHVPLLKPDGTFAGTVGAAIYFDELKDKFLKDFVFAEQGYAVLLDDNGDILYHPRSNFTGKNFWGEEMQQITGRGEALNTGVRTAMAGRATTARYVFEGKEKIGAFAPAEVFPGRFWVVAVTVPIEDALKLLK